MALASTPKCAHNAVHRPTSLEMFAPTIAIREWVVLRDVRRIAMLSNVRNETLHLLVVRK